MVNDLRYAFRMIRQYPWFSAAIISTLALGIGVNTTVFTLVNAVLFKPLPFPGGDRIVMVSATYPEQGRDGDAVSYADFRDFRQAASSFERLEAFANFPVNLSEQGAPPERYRGSRVSSGLFEMLHVQPVLGRGVLPADERAGAERVAVIGYGVWKDRYGAEPNVIGRTVRANDQPAVIVGVMPEGFKFPSNEEIWLNLVPDEQAEKRDNRAFMMTGMIKPGRNIAAARAELDIVAKRLQKDFPDSHKGYGITVRTFHEAMNGGPIRLVFLLMTGAVGFVLLIACANVANMLLGRALSRRREISIRVAVGASRGRIIRQLLVESVVLAALGGIIGLALSKYAVQAFSLASQDVGKPYWIRFEMDYAAFAYCAVICLAAGVTFGLMPALQAARVDLNETLKEGAKSSGTRRSGYLSAALVVFQFTLAVILLIAAGLMIRSFLSVQREFAGIGGEQILHARISLPSSRYATADARRQFFDKLLPRLAALPGAQSAAMASSIPGGGVGGAAIEIAGEPIVEHERRPRVSKLAVTPGYYELLGMRVLRGREFTAADGLAGKGTVIVSREFAARFFPNSDPIGRQFRFFDEKRQPLEWLTIIGLAPALRQGDPGDPRRGPVVTVPYNWEGWGGMAIVVRAASGNAAALAPAVRREVQELDGQLPLFDVGTLEDNLARQRWHLRVFGTVFLIFAMIALGMASVGIYAVIAHATAQRTREIGVRLALGAGAGSVVGMVMKRGLWQVGAGLAIGLIGAYFLSRLMGSLLGGISPSDPLTFGVVGLTLFLVGVAACLVPARRAAGLDPMVALREE